jgi:hypothetical protein
VRAALPCLALLVILALPAPASARESQFTIFEAPTELLSDDAALRGQALDEIAGLGVRSVRIVLYWHSVAPAAGDPGVPRFDEADPNAYPGFAATTARSGRRARTGCASCSPCPARCRDGRRATARTR